MEIVELLSYALLWIAFFYLLPALLILFSKKAGGLEKCLWIARVPLISWFSWIMFIYLAPLKRE